MFNIKFSSYDHNFCESQIYSTEPHPEYLNSISSLFITFIGVIALSRSNINFLLSLLYSSFIVNGITSCFYHYFNSIGWGLLDRMSMILIAFASLNLFIVNINKFFIINNCRNITFYNKLSTIILICYFTILLTIAGLHIESLFNIMFGLFLGSLIIFMYFITQYHIQLYIPYRLILLGWRGIKFISLSGVFWIITENLCHKYWFIPYLFGHVWWHIFVSYGGYLISLIPQYMFLHQQQQLNMLNIKIRYDIFMIPYLKFDNYNIHVSRV
jgi:hypothetical protein